MEKFNTIKDFEIAYKTNLAYFIESSEYNSLEIYGSNRLFLTFKYFKLKSTSSNIVIGNKKVKLYIERKQIKSIKYDNTDLFLKSNNEIEYQFKRSL